MRIPLWGLALVMTTGLASASDQIGLQTNSIGPTVGGVPTADLAGLLQRQGLFDPARLTTWRSYSFGISTSKYGTSSAGLLIQHLQYQISKPLTLYMEVGLLHNPLGMVGVKNGPQQASLVIPALDLIYRPKDNLTISFHYSQVPSSAYGYPYSSPWWTHPQERGW